MSSFFSEKYSGLTPYTPGEQPKDTYYVKLNTNESPFPPSPRAIEYASEEAGKLQLYSDPTCSNLVSTAAKYFGIDPDEILFTNGSDEILNFAFMAFCDEKHPAVFPDITYGFYPVFAQLNNIPYEEIPLRSDFTVNTDDYTGIGKTIFIANPNAPTGIALPLKEIEKIVFSNPGSVVVVDEAYVDFGGESCVSLIHKYDNLLVTQTFSKSRSLAGGRLGMGIACKSLIRDLNTVKYSTNPYNVNRMTMAAGKGAFEDDAYMKANCNEIIRVREETEKELMSLGFVFTDSSANFIFAKHPAYSGQTIYEELRKRNVLVRHFSNPVITDYNRITVGSETEMIILIGKLKEIFNEVPEERK